MKRVALLAYYYPPLGGAGVQRAAAIAEHLPRSGWDVSVVTGPAASGGRWTPRDDTLAADRGETIVRVGGPEPSRVTGRSARWLRRPTEWSRWWTRGAADAL